MILYSPHTANKGSFFDIAFIIFVVAGLTDIIDGKVARKLNISIKTVETHVSSVLRKLQLSNRHELARWASKRRIV